MGKLLTSLNKFCTDIYLGVGIINVIDWFLQACREGGKRENSEEVLSITALSLKLRTRHWQYCCSSYFREEGIKFKELGRTRDTRIPLREKQLQEG